MKPKYRIRECTLGLSHVMKATRYTACYPFGLAGLDLILPIQEHEFPTCLWCAAAAYTPW